MIRAALRYIAAPLLGATGATVVRVAREALARADAAELNEARTLGRVGELRDLLAAANQTIESRGADLDAAIDRATKAEHEIDTLRSELGSANEDDIYVTELRAALESVKVERDAAIRSRDAALASLEETASLLGIERLKVVHLEGEAAQLRARLDVATQRPEATEALRELAEAKVTIDDLRAGLLNCAASLTATEERAELMAADAETRCAWCLGPSEVPYSVLSDKGSAVITHPLCATHYIDNETSGANAIRARIAVRAASCASRRASPDPIAIACPTCGAMRGEPCSAAPFFPKALDGEPVIVGDVSAR